MYSWMMTIFVCSLGLKVAKSDSFNLNDSKLLGMDSMLGLIETITSAIVDHFTHLRSKLWAVVIGTCTVGFLFGLTLCTSGGIDVLGKVTRILG